MRLIIRQASTNPDLAPFDTAERKGVGHPDSLADLVADSFSRRYSTWCQQRFGIIPNHVVDKVNLVGAVAHVQFGGFAIKKPIDCYLFGKVTERVGQTPIPVDTMFEDVVDEVLPAALGNTGVLDHVRLYVNNTRGVAVDHDPQFYLPQETASLARVLAQETVANDTVICAGTSRPGLAAEVAMWLERHITGRRFRRAFPPVGTDVKVMVVRNGTHLDITVAVPFHPEQVGSYDTYRSNLADVQATLTTDLKEWLANEPRSTDIAETALHVNTKDLPGRGYLAPFGTSLGKGDCGAVGRGNRYNGAIEPLRPAGCEAPAGKNPLHHVGKIYTAVAAEVARRVLAETSVYAEVTIATRNGAALDQPAFVLVGVDRPTGAGGTAKIERIARECVAGAAEFTSRFLATDPLERFRGRDD